MVYNFTYCGSNTIPYAFIRATYPAGNVCTCSNGSKTLYAEGTSGYAIFRVPTSGTWTVSCPGTSYSTPTINVNTMGASYTATVS